MTRASQRPFAELRYAPRVLRAERDARLLAWIRGKSNSLLPDSATEVGNMADNRYYGVRVEGAKYGVGFGSALAIAISYNANHSILWAIIHGILGWLYVIYFALFRS